MWQKCSSSQLVATNSVDLHFIPSHTNNIPESDAIDALAKHAAEDGDEIDHDPFITSYKLIFRKTERRKQHKFLRRNVKPSAAQNNPDREPLVDGYYRIKT